MTTDVPLALYDYSNPAVRSTESDRAMHELSLKMGRRHFLRLSVCAIASVFLATFALPSIGALRLSNTGKGEVLIFPYYSAYNSERTEITVTNSSSYVKAAHIVVREGLRGENVLNWIVYLAPFDQFTFDITPSSSGGGQASTSDNTCTVPQFNGNKVDLVNYLYEGDSFNTKERTVNGFVEVFEVGQWDPSSEKGSAAVRGAAGDSTACSLLLAAWSTSISGDGAWVRNRADEALSWRGGQLSGRATVYKPAALVFLPAPAPILDVLAKFDAIAIEDFARYQLPAEYHSIPTRELTDWPDPALASGSQAFTSIVQGNAITQFAPTPIAAVSALLMTTNHQLAAEASGSDVSWIVSLPTKYHHTGTNDSLPPFTTPWNPQTSSACERIHVGELLTTPASNMSSAYAFSGISYSNICAAVNIVHSVIRSSDPISGPSWSTSRFPQYTSGQGQTINYSSSDLSATTRDRALVVDAITPSDTSLIGLPAIAIPFELSPEQKPRAVATNSHLTRQLTGIQPNFTHAGYSGSYVQVKVQTQNKPGVTTLDTVVQCESDGIRSISTSSGSDTTVSVGPLVASAEYHCEGFSITNLGVSELSNTFQLMLASAPENVLIDSYDTADGEITVSVVVGYDGGAPITQYFLTCSGGSETLTTSSSISTLTLTGLSNEVPYTCFAQAENDVTISEASQAISGVTPTAQDIGLPIWLLYEASKQK